MKRLHGSYKYLDESFGFEHDGATYDFLHEPSPWLSVLKGKKMPEEQKRLISEANKRNNSVARLQTPEARAKMAKTKQRRVVVKGIEFESHNAAASHFGITRQGLYLWKKKGLVSDVQSSHT